MVRLKERHKGYKSPVAPVRQSFLEEGHKSQGQGEDTGYMKKANQISGIRI